MKDSTYRAIDDALEGIGNERAITMRSKISGIEVARRAGVSKATLYRYLDAHPALRNKYNTLRTNVDVPNDPTPEALVRAHHTAEDEVNRLRTALAEAVRAAEQSDKLSAHQIELLWLDNARLRRELQNVSSQLAAPGNVVSIVRS
ncbi:hypothetical protein J2801_002223 [Paraburkholderia phenoliruptrix]|uniref:hypothetical protein n=1 Tax=Paraburkholderia phenoliruptrix TaxID=252970 RepID=UPI00285D44F7|nr:hypothetical protein [Paraburkholderia phenoliruptrix]MDR6419972.1 hypothetical protein [Paraburkholderia phenoliruptrix]